MNPLQNFVVDLSTIKTVGRDLQRPECILAERNGALWVADARGGLMHIASNGDQRLVLPGGPNGAKASQSDGLTSGSLPNGLAFDPHGDIIIANIGTDRVELLKRNGDSQVLFDQIDGKPLGKVNFVLRDSKGRLWVTISTMMNPWPNAIRNNLADGYIVLIDERGPRIVADGLAFTNEVRLDAEEAYLYVAETTARRVSRFPVRDDGSLGPRETYGPEQVGVGLIDGITFDAYGNLWCAMILADRIVAITPDGEALTIMDEGDQDAIADFETAFATGDVVPGDIMGKTGGTVATWITSVTFGGPDLKTVYLGSLKKSVIPYFQSPVAGLPMIHW